MKKFSFRLTKTAQALLLVLMMLPCFSTCKDDPETPKSSEKVMSNVVVAADGQTFNAVLQSDEKTFLITVPYIFDQDKLKTAVATFNLSTGAISEPRSGDPQDFTKDVSYLVTAEDGTTASYSIKMVVTLPSDAVFLSFSLLVDGKSFEGEINNVQSKITLVIPVSSWDDLEHATPTFTISPGATANFASDVVRDFREDVTYEIVAADGATKRTWTVSCNSDMYGAGFNAADVGIGKTFVELGYPGDYGVIVDDGKLFGDLWMYHAYCGDYIVLLSRLYISSDPSSPHCVKVVNKTTLNDAGSLNLGAISVSDIKMITSDYKGRCVAAVVKGNETEFFYWTTPTDSPVSVGKIGVDMATSTSGSSNANFQVAGDITGNAWITALAPLISTGEHYRVKVTNGQLASDHSIVSTGYSSADGNWFQMISPLDDSDEPDFVIGDAEGPTKTAGSIRCYINDFAGSTHHIIPPYWNNILQDWWIGTGFITARGRSPFVSALPINGKTYVVITSGSNWFHSAAVLNSDLMSLAHENFNIAHVLPGEIREWSYGAWADWYYNEELKEAYLAIWFGRIGLYTFKMSYVEK